MVEISSTRELRGWLANKPRNVAVMLAARSAMRIFPTWPLLLWRIDKRERAAFLLPVLHANIVSLVAAAGLTAKTEVRMAAAAAAADAAGAIAAAERHVADADADAAARAAARAVATAATDDAAVMAARAVSASASAARAAGATRASVAAGASAAADIWKALSADCITIGRSGSDRVVERAQTLLQDPLWPNGMPEWAVRGWRHLRKGLTDAAIADEHWQVWTRWYQDRLNGEPFNLTIEEQRVLVLEREGLWDRVKYQGPGVVNRGLQKIIDEHDEDGPTPDEVSEATPLGKLIEVEQQTGDISSHPPPERARAPSHIPNTNRLDNELRKLRRHVGELEAMGQRYEQYNLPPIIARVSDAIGAGVKRPEIIHDDCQDAIKRMEREIAVGTLPKLKDAPELNDLRDDLESAIRVTWDIYPEIERMAAAKKALSVRPATREEQIVFEKALDAFADVVDEKLRAEFREDLDRMKEAQEEAEARPDLDLPKGRVRDRLYNLIGTIARIVKYVRMTPEKLTEMFNEGVDIARKITQYDKARQALEPIWRQLGDLILDFWRNIGGGS